MTERPSHCWEPGYRSRYGVERIRSRGRCWACVLVPIWVVAVFAIVGWLCWPQVGGWF